MPSEPHGAKYFTFVETHVFTERVTRLGLEESVRKLQNLLLHAPEAGDLDPGTGGLRRVRMPDPERGKGKRSGARVHYLWLRHVSRIYLIFVYPKDEGTTPDGSKEAHSCRRGASDQGCYERGRRMKRELFAQLMESMTQALEHAQGKRDLRTTVLPAPPAPMSASEVQRVRKRLNASQAVFARYLNVSAKLVQAWESGRRRPEGPALMLLRLGKRDPAALAATAFGVSAAEVHRAIAAPRSSRRKTVGRRRTSRAA